MMVPLPIQDAIMIESLGITIESDIDARGVWWLTSPDRQGSMLATEEGDGVGISDARHGCLEARDNGYPLDGWSLSCVPVGEDEA